jgi:ATP phosphoribosyltransferase regulatory subunit
MLPLLLALELPAEQRQRLSKLLGLRGEPQEVVASLRQWLGPVALLDDLATMLASRIVQVSGASQYILPIR